MKVRTAIFGVYASALVLGFAAMTVLVLRDVRLRYVESMRRTMGDTAAFLAAFVATEGGAVAGWPVRLGQLPPRAELLRVFACDANGVVVFDSAHGQAVGQTYQWPMRGGGPVASENYTVSNVAEVAGELRVAAPVRRQGQLLGWVGVGRPLAAVAPGIAEARRKLVWSLGGVALVMAAAGWWVASRLTHSLERLTEYARIVRDGGAATPPVSRAREVATLARTFEEMRVALEGKAYVEHYTQALAHALKAPLSGLRGAAELLAENPPEEARVRFVANLRAETERLQQLVDRLLELAALESRRAGVGQSEVDLGEIVRAVEEAVQGTAAARGITLSVASGTGGFVRGEKFLLQQAVENLVLNALAFTPAGGKVGVAVQPGEQELAVVVEDSGPGVPDYALPQVFDRFYSLPRPDTGRKSSGLGLSITREIARLHGGRVSLANRDGGGARAEFVLPRARP
ncbi:MAG: two-component system sensor histidine kinase CreC [Verrucomicrobia bacterium]|nr:two-component system sensor histidine kinase CreC [Verrucomicrobiota bacterium]